jgi:hypothetical protein
MSPHPLLLSPFIVPNPLRLHASLLAPQIVCCGRRHLALVSRAKRPLYGGREVLVHPLELLGRIGADVIAGLRAIGPKL